MYICSEHTEKPAYRPGLERWSIYKNLWIRHWADFQKIYPYRFEEIYGPLTREKKEEVIKLIRCGNSLNYNPHVHLIGTREVVDTKTGEIIDIEYMPYGKIRYIWKKAFLKHLVKQGALSDSELCQYSDMYKKGFHIYFQKIDGTHNDVLFRTAEYMATGFFHNSQITAVNHARRTVTFRYRKHVDRFTREKHYAEKTIDIFSFMARMLYFLPDKHRKMIRYYGIYYHNIEQKLKDIDRATWARAVEHSFDHKPEECPRCSSLMIKEVVFSFFADREIKKLLKTHEIIKGYFIPYEKYRPP